MKLPSFGNKILSLDFGGNEIKIIEGQAARNSISISKAFALKLPPDVYYDGEILDKDAVVSLIKEELKKNKIRTDKVHGIINSSEIITRAVSLPKIPEKDLPSVISYQLDEMLPVDPDDYVVNSLILSYFTEDGADKVNVLLIGIPKKMVLEHLDLIKQIGLKPEILDYQGNAIAKLLNHNSLVNEFYNTSEMVVTSIDIGYSNSKLTIVKEGAILVTRVLDTGTKTMIDNISSLYDYTEEEIEEKLFGIDNINESSEEFTDYYRFLNTVRTTLENLMDEIDIIFRYYTSRETSNVINYIVLQGGLANIEGIENMFSNRFAIPSVKLNKLDKLKWDGELSKYSNAIGGLIRIEGVKK
ncbi:MAG: type IV pilus assembly protein PilM [Tissierellaceae bacterium]|nr:type IV pilus assembly protein PilM [Tissierellaceae bacterium]